MNEILFKLKSEKDVEQVSSSLTKLFALFDQHPDETYDHQNEIRFDFFMEDGIQVVSNAIRCDNLDDNDIKQGLKLMFQLAEENACHWQCIWESMGQLDGMIHFLETHSANESLFTKALDLCRKISQFRLLGVEAKDLLRWMPLWDLLLCGVEFYIERSHVFFSFCHLLESQKDNLIPLEMRARIHFTILRGLETLHPFAPEENQFRITASLTVLSRFTLDEENKPSYDTNGEDLGVAGSKSYSRCMFIPCSAAA